LTNKRTLGTVTERRAEQYLESIGYEILERNYRVKTGEIDLIGRDDKSLCFIEVKYRKDLRFGLPEEAVTPLKMRTIRRTAEWYLLTHPHPAEFELRFDVVAMDDTELRLYKNAF